MTTVKWFKLIYTSFEKFALIKIQSFFQLVYVFREFFGF